MVQSSSLWMVQSSSLSQRNVAPHGRQPEQGSVYMSSGHGYSAHGLDPEDAGVKEGPLTDLTVLLLGGDGFGANDVAVQEQPSRGLGIQPFVTW
jgi:hypothetical protein